MFKKFGEIIYSIRKSDRAHELVERIGEVGLDKALDEGVLKDIPVIGTAISLLKAGNDIQAFFFAQKVLSFLAEIESLTQEERGDFLVLHCSDTLATDRLGEMLLRELDKQDTPFQSKMLGSAFVQHARGGSRDDFQLNAYVIRALTPFLLSQFKVFCSGGLCDSVEKVAVNELLRLGLLNQGRTRSSFEGFIPSPPSPTLSDFGRGFYARFVNVE